MRALWIGAVALAVAACAPPTGVWWRSEPINATLLLPANWTAGLVERRSRSVAVVFDRTDGPGSCTAAFSSRQIGDVDYNSYAVDVERAMSAWRSLAAGLEDAEVEISPDRLSTRNIDGVSYSHIRSRVWLNGNSGDYVGAFRVHGNGSVSGIYCLAPLGAAQPSGALSLVETFRSPLRY